MSRSALPADLVPERVRVIVDSREQLPFDLSPLQTVNGTLATGDYSIYGLTHVVAVERKSIPDLIGCVGQSRERFEREIQRLLAYETRLIVVEGSWTDLECGNWRASITPAQAVGSVLGWIARGVPVVMAGDRRAAEKYTSRLLYIVARRKWRELRALAGFASLETEGAS